MHLSLLAAFVGLLCQVNAHGEHAHSKRPEVPPGADWTTRHMIEEHHIADFDAGAFFTLHDFDSTNQWTHDDIYKFYGLHHESTKHISDADKEKAVNQVLDLYDHDHNGAISFAEYTISEAKGVRLPDFGYGPGHHGDDEYEYEIHHWELYHDENTTEEDLIHPEDIEHFRHHEEMEAAEERQQTLDRMPINEANIPQKYRRWP